MNEARAQPGPQGEHNQKKQERMGQHSLSEAQEQWGNTIFDQLQDSERAHNKGRIYKSRY